VSFPTVRRVVFLVAAIVSFLPFCLGADETITIYGPGGPYPAMKNAAEVFEKLHKVKIEIVQGEGSPPVWAEKAKSDADIIYSGSQYMMTNFVESLQGAVDEATIIPLYLRPSAILVRPGNPKRIHSFSDLLDPRLKILVVDGGGMTGMWEDMAGKQGDIRNVRYLRRNIAAIARSGSEAKRLWQEKPELDVWLAWNTWQVANPQIADLVSVSQDYVIYRPMVIAMTRKGRGSAPAGDFFRFIQSPEGERIFKKWGWMGSKP